MFLLPPRFLQIHIVFYHDAAGNRLLTCLCLFMLFHFLFTFAWRAWLSLTWSIGYILPVLCQCHLSFGMLYMLSLLLLHISKFTLYTKNTSNLSKKNLNQTIWHIFGYSRQPWSFLLLLFSYASQILSILLLGLEIKKETDWFSVSLRCFIEFIG